MAWAPSAQSRPGFLHSAGGDVRPGEKKNIQCCIVLRAHSMHHKSHIASQHMLSRTQCAITMECMVSYYGVVWYYITVMYGIILLYCMVSYYCNVWYHNTVMYGIILLQQFLNRRQRFLSLGLIYCRYGVRIIIGPSFSANLGNGLMYRPFCICSGVHYNNICPASLHALRCTDHYLCTVLPV